MKIYRSICPSNKFNIKCPYSMNAEFIVVHNTANDANARAEIQYMISNNNYTSFHYAVDDKEIVQAIEENRNAYHAGDGVNGNGNRKGISIEICYSRSGGEKFEKAENLAAEFIAYKLKEKGWGIDKVKKHQDFSGKYCPHRTLDLGWERFLNKIRQHLGEQQVIPEQKPIVNELYKVRITTPVLRIRQNPNTNSPITGKVFENQVYTIVEENSNWGKLKSGAGWICLDYTSKNINSSINNKFSVKVNKKRAMVRSKSNSKSPLAGSRELHYGDVFIATDLVKGENVNGNNLWYKSAKGNYVWSGGLNKI